MTADVQRALMDSSLFTGIQPDCQTCSFEDGESLSQFADDQDSIGLIVSGMADIWCQASDGSKTLLNTIRHADCFGIAFLNESDTMLTQVTAKGTCKAAFIKKAVIRTLLTQNSAFAGRYFTLCNRKLQFLLNQIAILTSQSCRTRLIAYLLFHQNEQHCVMLHGTKDDLASRLSVSRAAIYRELGELTRAGLIRQERQRIEILSSEQLESLLYEHV